MVTIAIPTYNEARHIERIITTFLGSQYPGLVEILVVDGDSTDGTPDIVQRLSDTDARVRLLHNPLRNQASALNIALAEMRGDIFLRADGHSDYAADYIESCVATLIETQALNVGGIQRFVATTPFQAGVALAAQSVLGNGGSRHHNACYDGPSDTVFLGCWWKRDLERLDTAQLPPTVYVDREAQQKSVASFFDRQSVPNEDSEINARLRRVAPDAVYVSSRIKVWYYPRTAWSGLRKQYFNYGRGRCRTVALHPDQSPPRVKLPLIAGTLAPLLGVVDLLFFRGKLRTKWLFLLAGAVPFLESMRVTLKHRHTFQTAIWRGSYADMPALLQRWWYCSVALWTMTPAYFTGYVYHFCCRCFRWRRKQR